MLIMRRADAMFSSKPPMPQNNIPVSVIVVTSNEEARIAVCLSALRDFSDVWVVDSVSADRTCEIAQQMGARIVDFAWDGAYPKKRQWCLETLELAHNWVLFVDADEIVTAELVEEIRGLDFAAGGYFVQGRYVWNGTMLRYGLCNNKLVLINRRKIEFPVVDDLDLPGMGEIEGHYQPVLKAGFEGETIGQLRAFMVHDAGEDLQHWRVRHLRYAAWEAGMNARDAWPCDPVLWRQCAKQIFRAMPFRGFIAFVHCYVWKMGVLDGRAGFDFAASRATYYAMIASASKANKARGHGGGVASSEPEGL